MTKTRADEVEVENPESVAIRAARAESGGGVAPQLVALDTFVRLKFGAKNIDQSAAFARWASQQKLTRLPQKQWDELLELFQNKRIGG